MKHLTTQLVSFGIIGGINTAIDTGSYALLLSLGAPLVPATICATTLGLASSLVLNRRFTFKEEAALTPRTTAKFFAVTLVGLWVLQPAIIVALRDALSIKNVGGLLLIKLAATAVSMVWNFCWYRWYVFAPARS